MTESSSTLNQLSDMVWIPGGTFWMGSDDHYPEEAPRHEMTVGAFLMDTHPVTNEQFAEFVEATGHVTPAEKRPEPLYCPGGSVEMLYPGSFVFLPPDRAVPPGVWQDWWRLIEGANWRHPYGPTSSITTIGDHPVVHVAYDDAAAYARWANKALPNEAEWEFAACGGHSRRHYAWGDELEPSGRIMAKYWRGEFPYENLALRGQERTSGVKSFPPNDYGLYDMIGNVWEWTCDRYGSSQEVSTVKSCCDHKALRAPDAHGGREPFREMIARKVLKGGSHLCAENYCRRYRPAARHPQPVDMTTSHVGFRCIIRKSE